TVERLIFLHARHIAQSKRGALSEGTFVEIIKNLAKRYREKPSLSPSELKELIPSPFADQRVYQEIIDGGLLIRQPGHVAAGYTIERRRLVYGLGLLLADDLASAGLAENGRRPLENELAHWLEPHPEIDLKVEICGAALFHSLVDGSYPQLARRTLLRYWLELRNWDDNAQAAFVHYVVRCPEDFIAVTEDVWASERDLGAAEEFVAKAFTKHRDR